jgi:REP element-mobilizing transposase RayT
MSRGNSRQRIYRHDGDCHRFVQLLGEMQHRFALDVWAYVLVRNHYHIVLRTQEANLSRAMQWLGVSYAGWFNWRHNRHGHLFQGRFKSFAVTEEAYLRRLILYVHRNPLRAGIVDRLAEYRWSSYPKLAYRQNWPDWLDATKPLRLFNDSHRQFRQAVQEYSGEESRLLENLHHGILLGTDKAWERLKRAMASVRVDREKPQTRALAGGDGLPDFVTGCAVRMGLDARELASLRRPVRGRTRRERDMLMYLAWRSGRFRLSQIGEYFHVGYTTVANARTRVEVELDKNRKLRKQIARALSNDK